MERLQSCSDWNLFPHVVLVRLKRLSGETSASNEDAMAAGITLCGGLKIRFMFKSFK